MAKRKIVATDQRPFTIVYDDFLRSEILTYYEKLIFIIIKSYADNDTMQAFPSIKKIHEVSGISMAQVKRCLNHMKEIGVIKIEKGKPKNGKRSNLYTLYDYAALWNTGTLPDNIEDLNEERQLVAKLKAKGYIVTKQKDFAEASTTTLLQSPHQNPTIIPKKNITKQHAQSQANERYPEEWITDFFGLNDLKSENPTKRSEIDDVAHILYTILNSKKKTIKVNSEEKPTMVVVGRILKLTQDMILYVINQFIAQTEKINNPRSYIISCLYNAQEQYDLALRNQVSHDMAHWNE